MQPTFACHGEIVVEKLFVLCLLFFLWISGALRRAPSAFAVASAFTPSEDEVAVKAVGAAPFCRVRAEVALVSTVPM
jgi:hypothetical protein